MYRYVTEFTGRLGFSTVGEYCFSSVESKKPR